MPYEWWQQKVRINTHAHTHRAHSVSERINWWDITNKYKHTKHIILVFICHVYSGEPVRMREIYKFIEVQGQGTRVNLCVDVARLTFLFHFFLFCSLFLFLSLSLSPFVRWCGLLAPIVVVVGFSLHFFFVRLLLMWFLRWSSVCAANHANLTQPYVVYDWRYAHSIEIHLLRTLQHRRNPIWQLTGWFVEFCFSHRIMRNEALLMHSTFWKFQCFNMGYFGELQEEWILCV